MFIFAVEQVALVRGGEALLREFVEVVLCWIEAFDFKLNAFVELDGERALVVVDELVLSDV